MQTPSRPRWMRWGLFALQAAAALVVTGALIGAIWTSKPSTRQWLKDYASIPVVAAIVGWGTNVVAIFMTFYPLEFAGCWPEAQCYGMPLCGWQGIIPASCQKMAEEAVNLMTG